MRMPPEPGTHSGHDSFVDVLHSEIISESENLTAWVKQVSDQGAIESLFAMETWLKGIRSFFRTEHLPLSAAEKAELARRSFAAEIGVVRQAVQVCEIHACNVMKPGMGGKLEFEEFMEIQMRKDRMPDFSLSRMVEQLTPRDSVSQLLAFLNDLRVTMDAFKDQTGMDYQLFLSLGRFFDRELKSCRYIDMLLSQHLRLQYDLIENKSPFRRIASHFGGGGSAQRGNRAAVSLPFSQISEICGNGSHQGPAFAEASRDLFSAA